MAFDTTNPFASLGGTQWSANETLVEIGKAIVYIKQMLNGAKANYDDAMTALQMNLSTLGVTQPTVALAQATVDGNVSPINLIFNEPDEPSATPDPGPLLSALESAVIFGRALTAVANVGAGAEHRAAYGAIRQGLDVPTVATADAVETAQYDTALFQQRIRGLQASKEAQWTHEDYLTVLDAELNLYEAKLRAEAAKRGFSQLRIDAAIDEWKTKNDRALAWARTSLSQLLEAHEMIIRISSGLVQALTSMMRVSAGGSASQATSESG